MTEERMKGLLGLALRARQAAAGQDACSMLIRNGKCGALLIDGDAAANTRKKYEDLCRRTGTPVITLPAGLIEKATGRTNMAMALQKGNFAQQFTDDAVNAEPKRKD